MKIVNKDMMINVDTTYNVFLNFPVLAKLLSFITSLINIAIRKIRETSIKAIKRHGNWIVFSSGSESHSHMDNGVDIKNASKNI
jgi:hypothetical protein